MTTQSDNVLEDIAPGTFDTEVTSGRKNFGKLMTGLVIGCVVVAILPLGSIIFMLLKNGLSRLFQDFPSVFTELPPPPLVDGGGFSNAIVGTLITCLIGALISLPVGILTAIYTIEFGRGNKLSQFVRFCTNVLSGVPSIIAGLFAYGIVVLTMGNFSAIAGGVALSVLMMPIIIRTAEEGLKSIPSEVRQGLVGIGATNFQGVASVILPATLPFIATGATLALARAAGETAPLLFTALFNQFQARSLKEPIATLSVLIYNFAIAPYKNQNELAWAAALVIVALIMTVSVLSRTLTARKVY
ncbi:MAG: phosphate ABC transporter permease PstA [Pegethrix bostrychoides GSE-TBD4-15B]|jgi:phosphate transport system permease protein|uniref:Phosphate transport system permease protein PstA n=1 Tax=Pegethrix bostrychoides GSE-TBD4-15B TaxID=2839662 RepID=A0A951P702_9CYAN|nr:phosphate ABC transporter permease PstA [Pegethrix bostrychoides GSE-TBD4-15B]